MLNENAIHERSLPEVSSSESRPEGRGFSATLIPDAKPSALRRALRAAVPGRARPMVAGTLRPLRYRGTAVRCPCCSSEFSRFIPHRGRPFAKCPRCGALERHRLLVGYLRDQTALFAQPLRVLHVAPEWCLLRELRRQPNLDYVTADLDSPLAEHHVDLLDLPFSDGSFDWVICNHVLEHVADDRTALQEIRRVLRPGGVAILMSPIDTDCRATVEDPSIVSPEERHRIYGQRDHLRRYGRDFAARVAEQNFEVTGVSYLDQLDHDQVERQGLRRQHELFSDEEIFVCRATDHPSRTLSASVG
jgi:SAM-dependent methyltransferase